MGTWYRATNYLDCKLTDAIHKSGASNEAKRFAKKVVLGKTYYTIKSDNGPGARQYLDEHVFTKISTFTGLPEGAPDLWACAGPVYDNRNAAPCAGLMTLSEYREWLNEDDGPNIRGGNLNDYADKPKHGRRAA
jgi:hypothetical protein